MRPEQSPPPVAVYTDLTELDPTPGKNELEAAGWQVRFAGSADPESVLRVAPEATALLVGDEEITPALLDALPGLEIIATQSVGFDFIDVEECSKRGIVVANVPDASTEEVACHALAMALALIRGLPMYDRALRHGTWNPTGVVGLARPSNLTLGILGLGRIGQRLADMASPLFGGVIGYDPAEFPTVGIQRRSLEHVLSESDVISVHLPLNEDTHHLLGPTAFRTVKRGTRIVNVARGALIDETALIDAINIGQIGAVALDVFETEPADLRSPLFSHGRVLVTPHVAYLSPSSGHDLVVKQARNVIAYGRQSSPVTAVNG
jgi:phosphoglycerate dehydrogenase-like enzyme